MRNAHDLMRQRLLQMVGLGDQPKARYNLPALQASEWSPEFERLMRNRLIMGALRYGLINAPGKKRYDRVPSMVRRLRLYAETGNREYLVDVANLCLLEFVEGKHPQGHFHSVDDTAEHVKATR